MNRKELAAYFRRLECKYIRKSKVARFTHERDRFIGRAQSYHQAWKFIELQIDKSFSTSK